MSGSSPVGLFTRKILPSDPVSEKAVAAVNGQDTPSDRLKPKASYYKRYRILGVFGGGGFGDVYLAVQEQEHTSKYVAIKVLNQKNRNSEEEICGLQREAEVMGSLHHRLFPTLIDLTYFCDQWALIMEWIPGISLREACRFAGHVPLSVALEIVADLANGIRALHERGKVFGGPAAHCDIKPGNIRIGPFGSVRLVDLGSTRCWGKHRTASTYPYCAPELRSGYVRPAVDVFSLGVVLLAMLTRLPDEGVQTKDTAGHYLESHLQRFPYGTDREVIALVRRMLDSHSGDRPCARDVEVACRRMRRWIDGPCVAEWVPEALAQAGTVAEAGALTGMEVTVPGPIAMVETEVEDLRIPAVHQPFYAPKWAPE